MKQFADTIVRNAQGQVLMLNRVFGDSFMSGKWGFPGGHIEEGEESSVAAVREAQEETGLIVEVKHLLTKTLDDCTIYYFEGIIKDSNILPQIVLDAEEHRGWEWVEIEDIADMDLIADLKTYVDEELLSKLYSTALESRGMTVRELTPEEQPAIMNLDTHWKVIEDAFDANMISDDEFFKAKEKYIAAKKKEAFETIKKAYDNNQISDDAYVAALVLMKGGKGSGRYIHKKKFKPQLNSSGKPKVYYHSSDNDFSEFKGQDDEGYERKHSLTNRGIYFHEAQPMFAQYGKHKYEVHLDIRKPFIIDNRTYISDVENPLTGKLIEVEHINADDIKFLKKQGYDAVSAKYPAFQTVVFNPSQIKIVKKDGKAIGSDEIEKGGLMKLVDRIKKAFRF